MEKYSEGEKIGLVIVSFLVGCVAFAASNLLTGIVLGLSYPLLTKLSMAIMNFATKTALIKEEE